MSARPVLEPGPRVAAGLAADVLARPDEARASGPVVIGFSGGVDSFVLLHLALTDPAVGRVLAADGGPRRVVAAHLDHAMRPDSAAAADTLVRWATSAGVDLRTRRLADRPASEEEAREARYDFLAEIAVEVGATAVWTAHHGDDQIETVLFRILRGAGLAGLSGIPARRGRIARPFLLAEPPIRREELDAYANAHGLPVLEDPTNAEPEHATRNRLRHVVLPLLERTAPGAGDRLLRLARNARRAEAERSSAVAWILDGLAEGPNALPVSLWKQVEPPLRRALLRGMTRRMGVALSEAATEAALALSPAAQSGRGVDLPGGLRFEREFDMWVLSRSAPDAEGQTHLAQVARIPSPAGGEADIAPGAGRRCSVRWAPAETPPPAGRRSRPTVAWRVEVPVEPDAFPLTIRGWREGDRMSRPFGSVSLAKAWAEARVPRRERPGRVVVVDRRGTLLAAEGLGVAESGPTVHHAGGDGSAGSPHLVIHLEPKE